MTLSEFAWKVENEGGLYEAVVGYGLSHEDINRDDNPEFYRLLKKFVKQARDLNVLDGDIEYLMGHYREDEDE